MQRRVLHIDGYTISYCGIYILTARMQRRVLHIDGYTISNCGIYILTARYAEACPTH